MIARTYMIPSREALLRVLSTLANLLINPKHPMQITIGPYRKARSHEQNKRYWAILNEIAVLKVQGETFSAEAWHEYFKGRFIGFEDVKLPNGKVLHRPMSTTDLDVVEFGEYMTEIEAWAAGHGLLLSDLAQAA